jgi:antagonist of KipI
MSLTILKEGILTTLQDLGRTGSRRFGVNPTGVMDHAAARIANVLLGNDENEAVLEMHFPASEIQFDEACSIAICGGDFSPRLNSKKLPGWSTVRAEAGDTLSFTSKVRGERAYLALRGGFNVELWRGSKSTNLAAGIGGGRLRAGDRIPFVETVYKVERRDIAAAPSIIPRYSRFPTVRILAGAEIEKLSEDSRKDLVNEAFVISKRSDRMGFRLEGKPLNVDEGSEIISAAVNFGTIQLLPDGQLIVLMADHQTTGGYPRAGHVIGRDLPLVAQLGPGDGVGFHFVDIETAEALAAEFDRDLAMLKVGVKLASK